jgi:hypothetical protein
MSAFSQAAFLRQPLPYFTIFQIDNQFATENIDNG